MGEHSEGKTVERTGRALFLGRTWGPWLGRSCRQVWSFAGARGLSSVFGAVLLLVLHGRCTHTLHTWSLAHHAGPGWSMTWVQCPGSWTEQQPAERVWGQMWPWATLSIRIGSSAAGTPPKFTLSPAPLLFPSGALERGTLKLQEEQVGF